MEVFRGARRRGGRWGAWLAVTLVIAGAGLLVWLGAARLGGSREERVRGVLTAVEARDIGHTQSFALRDTSGRELRFRADDTVDMTPGHMREHMTFGEAVTVYYRRSGDALIATRVTD